MDKETSIIPGAVFAHEEGFLYRVKKLVLNATGYENGVAPKPTVVYTQLTAGTFPVGTVWVRDVDDFLEHFKPLSEQAS